MERKDAEKIGNKKNVVAILQEEKRRKWSHENMR